MRSPSTLRHGRIPIAVLLLALGGFGLRAGAQPAKQTQPLDFDGGFDTRIRQVSRVNLLDFDRAIDWNHDDIALNDGSGLASDADLFRVRHRLWGQFRLRSGPRLYARLTTEWWRFVNPWRWNPSTSGKTEVILDNLYLDIPKVPYIPGSLRIGRQDIVRGEGFILLEGGPLDGSRSIYQNAILLGLDGQKLRLAKTKLELMAIRNLAWDPMVIVNGPKDAEKAAGKRKIVEWNETAFGLYVTQTSLPKQAIEGYWIYKEQELSSAKDPFLKLSTVGARVSGELPQSLRFAAEGAYQFGTGHTTGVVEEALGFESDFDHRSYGGYAWLSRSFIAMLHPTIKLGAVYLSGDDPDDRDAADPIDQGWVPVFSRWPEWSELYIYTQLDEAPLSAYAEPQLGGGRFIAYWTNLRSLNAAVTIQPTGAFKLSYTYHALHAPQASASDLGHSRGCLHEWLATTDLGRHASMHFLIERFKPGDFYSHRVDDAWFIRTELMLKY